jgi:hypothetical protein
MTINWTENVEIRQHNGQCAYGPWMATDDDGVPSWVDDLIADEIAENDAHAGQVEQGGSIWIWRKRTDD